MTTHAERHRLLEQMEEIIGLCEAIPVVPGSAEEEKGKKLIRSLTAIFDECVRKSNSYNKEDELTYSKKNKKAVIPDDFCLSSLETLLHNFYAFVKDISDEAEWEQEIKTVAQEVIGQIDQDLETSLVNMSHFSAANATAVNATFALEDQYTVNFHIDPDVSLSQKELIAVIDSASETLAKGRGLKTTKLYQDTEAKEQIGTKIEHPSIQSINTITKNGVIDVSSKNPNEKTLDVMAELAQKIIEGLQLKTNLGGDMSIPIKVEINIHSRSDERRMALEKKLKEMIKTQVGLEVVFAQPLAKSQVFPKS